MKLALLAVAFSAASQIELAQGICASEDLSPILVRPCSLLVRAEKRPRAHELAAKHVLNTAWDGGRALQIYKRPREQVFFLEMCLELELCRPDKPALTGEPKAVKSLEKAEAALAAGRPAALGGVVITGFVRMKGRIVGLYAGDEVRPL